MAFSRQHLVELNRRRARRYDVTSNLYYLLGLRMTALRKKAVQALELNAGDTVVELGCGTGLNFRHLQDAVGAHGTILGVDISEEMLAIARRRVQQNGWANVALLNQDLATFEFPLPPDAVLSTFALTLVPEYEDVIARSVAALSAEGSFSLLDLKRPDSMPEWVVRALAFLSRPFGVTMDLGDRRPWECLQRHFSSTHFEAYWFDCVYVASGSMPVAITRDSVASPPHPHQLS